MSVTTFLDQKLDKRWLTIWKKRVGEAKAEAIMKESRDKGTLLHNTLERLVEGQQIEMATIPYEVRPQLLGMHRMLSGSLSECHGIEIPVCSKVLKLAGRMDLLGIWDGQLSVIDYKTSKKVKREADILGYFLQSSIYGYMCSETYGIMPSQVVILIALEDGRILKFTKSPLQYKNKIMELLRA